jgi:hypothetical protein
MNDVKHEINDLLVLIDTLQANLRSAMSALEKADPKAAESIAGVQSYKWVSKWRPTS